MGKNEVLLAVAKRLLTNNEVFVEIQPYGKFQTLTVDGSVDISNEERKTLEGLGIIVCKAHGGK